METPSSEDFHCTGCNRIFKEKKQLETHQLVCTLPKKGASFYTAWRELGGKNDEANRVPVTEKIALPASQGSQTADEKSDETTEKCTLCSRTFGNHRGLQQIKSNQIKSNQSLFFWNNIHKVLSYKNNHLNRFALT